MAQVFVARERFEFSNGAIGWCPGGPFDCLGPYAKVQNCPIAGMSAGDFLRRTAMREFNRGIARLVGAR